MCLCLSAACYAQEKRGDLAIGDATKYKIGEITVTGSQTYNENTVVAFTGLRKGEEVFVPGERISQVVKKMWDLKLFSDIRIFATDIIGDPEDDIIDTINLEINIIEVPNLNDVTIEGLRKGKTKDLKEELQLTKGRKATENLVTTTRSFIEDKYRKKGFLFADAKVKTRTVQDTTGKNIVNMKIDIDRGKKVKISDIIFTGNEKLSNKQLRGSMSNTKKKRFYSLLKRSKYIEEDFQEDLLSVIDKYKESGYRDARVLSDTLTKENEKTIALNIKVEEGRKYYFGDIKFIGNTA
jgi:outer membrane protein insertion porin family